MIFTFRSMFFGLFLFAASSVFAQSIASIVEQGPNKEALWSVSVRDSNGKEIESYQANKLISPASNQKLFTTAAVLDGLGRNFRYKTHIYGQGRLEQGNWKGWMLIKAAGDPSISGIMYSDDRDYVFKSFVEQLSSKGIEQFDGEIWADVSYFDDEIYPPGWDWRDLSFYYGVEIAPLSFNNNAIDLVVDAQGEIGGRPRIFWKPEYAVFGEFVNQQRITAPGTKYREYYRRIPGDSRIYLRSTLPQGYLEEESLSIEDAGRFFVASFENFLIQNGMRKKQQKTFRLEEHPVDVSKYRILATHTSEPLSKLIEWTNKESDNFYTEMLLKTLAAEQTGVPGTFENGIREVRTFLGELGVDTTYVVMNDGSGMASGNFTKTSILSDFLAKMQHHPEFETFFKSLSVAGIDGTIAHRMKGTPLYNNFRGKSGYKTGVRTLSGYLTTKSGKRLIVSMATNHFLGKVSPIDAVHEQILQYLYDKY